MVEDLGGEAARRERRCQHDRLLAFAQEREVGIHDFRVASEQLLERPARGGGGGGLGQGGGGQQRALHRGDLGERPRELHRVQVVHDEARPARQHPALLSSQLRRLLRRLGHQPREPLEEHGVLERQPHGAFHRAPARLVVVLAQRSEDDPAKVLRRRRILQPLVLHAVAYAGPCHSALGERPLGRAHLGHFHRCARSCED
mmetsp:Transcript_12682/g.30597  ORF Transcript_12682/g.30597 Transcript_12682/m.30597 type:complete len:201 (+) Transcript_12682:1344-1946(+)